MWSLFYFFLKVVFCRIDRDQIQFGGDQSRFGSLDLQAIFSKFSAIQSETACYMVPRPNPDERFEMYCSGDLARVFWFALSKAFRSCISSEMHSYGEKIGKEKYTPSILDCVLETEQDTYYVNPGIAFRREMCVVRKLLPPIVWDAFNCVNVIPSSGFYLLKSRGGHDCISPCELLPEEEEKGGCTCETAGGWDYCNQDECS